MHDISILSGLVITIRKYNATENTMHSFLQHSPVGASEGNQAQATDASASVTEKLAATTLSQGN